MLQYCLPLAGSIVDIVLKGTISISVLLKIPPTRHQGCNGWLAGGTERGYDLVHCLSLHVWLPASLIIHLIKGISHSTICLPADTRWHWNTEAKFNLLQPTGDWLSTVQQDAQHSEVMSGFTVQCGDCQAGMEDHPITGYSNLLCTAEAAQHRNGALSNGNVWQDRY
jgi:hypothetical protein